jgi:outer membrane protein insertion porin family
MDASARTRGLRMKGARAAIGALALLAPSAAFAEALTSTTATATIAPPAPAVDTDDEDFAPPSSEPSIELDEDEPPATFIEAIEIIGNSKTSRSVILRRLLVAVNDLVDDDRIDQSRLRVLSTGYFKTAEFSLKRGSRRGRAVLVIEVEERNTITLDGVFLGWSEVTPFFGGASIIERNFLGRGMSVGTGVVAGEDRRAVEVAVFVPDLSDTPLQLSASAIFVEAAEILDPDDPSALELEYSRVGGRLGVGLGVGTAQRVSLDYRLESIHADRLPNLDPAVIRAAPSIQFDESILSTLSMTYENDTRDDDFVPTQGGRVALAVEMGSKIIASRYEFSKYTGELQLAFAPFEGHALALRLFGGVIQGQTPFFNQFFVRDHAFFALGRNALPRALEVNFSEFNDYDDLILSVGGDYSIPIAGGGDVLYRAFVYGAIDVSATASLDELQEDKSGRGASGRLPISFDVGLKLDTFIGRFTLSASYVADLVL